MDRLEYLLVGVIARPHGIRGELRVRPVTERPELRFCPGAELLGGPDERRLERLEVETVRPFREELLIVFRGREGREQAEALRGWELYIPADQAAEPETDRWYPHQLLGLEVRDTRGERLGTVREVLEYPGQDLLEIERPGGASFLLPMVEEFLVEVDLDRGCLVVNPPAGLVEL